MDFISICFDIMIDMYFCNNLILNLGESFFSKFGTKHDLYAISVSIHLNGYIEANSKNGF